MSLLNSSQEGGETSNWMDTGESYKYWFSIWGILQIEFSFGRINVGWRAKQVFCFFYFFHRLAAWLLLPVGSFLSNCLYEQFKFSPVILLKSYKSWISITLQCFRRTGSARYNSTLPSFFLHVSPPVRVSTYFYYWTEQQFASLANSSAHVHTTTD